MSDTFKLAKNLAKDAIGMSPEIEITKIFTSNKEKNIKEIKADRLKRLFQCNVLNNNSKNLFDGKLKLIGDETEKALVKFSENFGFDKEKFNKLYPRVYEFPFDSKRKMMSVIVKEKGKFIKTKKRKIR